VLESATGDLWEVGKAEYVFATKTLVRPTGGDNADGKGFIYSNSSGNTSPIAFDNGGAGIAFQPAASKVINDINFTEASLSGLVTGGALTQGVGNTISITAGDGIIVDSYSTPGDMHYTEVEWLAATDMDAEVPADPIVGFKSIIVTNAGVIDIISGTPSPANRRENILLGGYYYESGNIKSVISAPAVIRQTATDYRDFISFIPFTNQIKDLIIEPYDNSVLSFVATQHDVFLSGINYHDDPLNPNIEHKAEKGQATNGIEYQGFYSSGNAYNAPTKLVPLVYEGSTDNDTNLTGDNATIHYLYTTLAGDYYMQLGTGNYGDFNTAVNSLYADKSDKTNPAITGAMILVAQLVVSADATSFDGIEGKIFPITESSSGSGGSSNSAVNISYDNAGSGLSAANVQAAIDELDTNVDGKLSAVNGITEGMYETIVAVPALAVDVSASNVQTKAISGDTTFTFTGWTANASSVDLYLTVTGTPVVSFPVEVTFKTSPTLSAGLNILTFTSVDGGSNINGFVARDQS